MRTVASQEQISRLATMGTDTLSGAEQASHAPTIPDSHPEGTSSPWAQIHWPFQLDSTKHNKTELGEFQTVTERLQLQTWVPSLHISPLSLRQASCHCCELPKQGKTDCLGCQPVMTWGLPAATWVTRKSPAEPDDCNPQPADCITLHQGTQLNRTDTEATATRRYLLH